MVTNEFHCADCGETDERVLELDQPVDEHSPCDVVCLHCRTRRTARRWTALRQLFGAER